MVLDFTLDPMHLIDLGVARQMFLWFFKYILKPSSREIISQRMEVLAKYTTKEFVRKPRSPLRELANFKAVEFRNIILYYFPVLMLGLVEVSDTRYSHMLLIHVAYRCMLTGKAREKLQSRVVGKIRDWLRKFVEGFKGLYGSYKLNYNVHNLLHLHLFLTRYGTFSL